MGASIISATGSSLSFNGSDLSAGTTNVVDQGMIAGTFGSSLGSLLNPISTSMSANGQYITYINGNSNSNNIYVSSNFGTSFSQVTGTAVGQAFLSLENRYYKAVSVCSTGQYQTVVEFYSSDLSGGQYVDNGGGIFVSSNYGVTWKETYAAYISNTRNSLGPQMGYAAPTWESVVVSSDGTIQIAGSSAGGNPNLVISKQKIPSVNGDWEASGLSAQINGIYMSDSGDRFSYTLGYGTNITNYYIDLNGANLAPTLTAAGSAITPSGANSISGLSLSRDGTVIGIVGVDGFSNGIIYRYDWTDRISGPTLENTNSTMTAARGPIAMTSNGQVQVTINNTPTKGLNISINKGVTFTTSTNGSISVISINNILLSSNGQYAFIVSDSYALYKCFVPTNPYSITPYVPAVSTNWPTGPTSVGQALDLIAEFFSVLEPIGEKTFNLYSSWY
jgi:hypothetical protein